MVFIRSKLGNVIDIQDASTANGTLLDAWPQKAADNANQQWDFVADPGGSGYFFIQSALDGNVIDIQAASTAAGAPLDAWPQKTSDYLNQLWAFIPDPAGSGYFFIRSALDGNVIDIQGASTANGALLDVYPQKSSDYDNQLWQVVGGSFPAPTYTGLTWGPAGTGPESDSATVGSSGDECQFQVGLTIQSDGSYTFSGYYENRGSVWWGTAPPQNYAVGFLIFDTLGKAYGFAQSGTNIPSAPQAGAVVTWTTPGTSQVLADNWYGIAAKHGGQYFWHNSWSESIWQVLSGWWSDVESVVTIAEDVIEIVGEAASVAIAGSTAPPRPAGAPAGVSGTASGSSGAVTGSPESGGRATAPPT